MCGWQKTIGRSVYLNPFQGRPASERCTHVLGERRKKTASYESKSGLTWGQPAYTQAHTCNPVHS